MRSVMHFVPKRIITSTVRSFRSVAALEAIARARDENVRNIALYNYPSFSGAFSALFAHLFHSRLHLPCLILPFSSVEPLRVEDLQIEGLERCYLLDFLGPKGFAMELCQQSSCIIGFQFSTICDFKKRVRAFEHRRSMLSRVPAKEDCLENLFVHYDTEKSSSMAAYEYFSVELADASSINGLSASLLEAEDKDRVERVLKYIEDGDLRRWSFPDIRSFNIGLQDWRSKLNCITNPFIFEQLVRMSPDDLIAKGNAHVSSIKNSASIFLDKVFKVHLGRGFYGECLGVRVDGNADLSDELGKQLSLKSAASGLRPIGAVIYMQRNNLKMCLRSTDGATDTSEIAKAYGGGGMPSSSSFIIRMDEYNHWLAVNRS